MSLASAPSRDASQAWQATEANGVTPVGFPANVSGESPMPSVGCLSVSVTTMSADRPSETARADGLRSRSTCSPTWRRWPTCWCSCWPRSTSSSRSCPARARSSSAACWPGRDGCTRCRCVLAAAAGRHRRRPPVLRHRALDPAGPPPARGAAATGGWARPNACRSGPARQLDRRGPALLIVARFIPGGRTASTFMAGPHRVPAAPVHPADRRRRPRRGPASPPCSATSAARRSTSRRCSPRASAWSSPSRSPGWSSS